MRTHTQRLQVLATALCALMCIALVCAIAPSVAHADGDPASDALLYTDVFPPLSFPMGDKRTHALAQQAAKAKQAGKGVKVAIISNAQDLGAVPTLFGNPNAYARFLAAEIVYKFVGPLIVVMPQGIAVTAEPPTNKTAKAKAKVAAAKIKAAKITPGQTPGDLAVTAGQAIQAVTGIAPVGLTATGKPAKKSHHVHVSATTLTLIILGIVVVALAIWTIVALVKKRRAMAEELVRGKPSNTEPSDR